MLIAERARVDARPSWRAAAPEGAQTEEAPPPPSSTRVAAGAGEPRPHPHRSCARRPTHHRRPQLRWPEERRRKIKHPTQARVQRPQGRPQGPVRRRRHPRSTTAGRVREAGWILPLRAAISFLEAAGAKPCDSSWPGLQCKPAPGDGGGLRR
jgi:hypothetical protein